MTRNTTDEEHPASEREGQRDTAVQFEQMILDNLRKAGVQKKVKNERLVFTRLEPHPGQWIQAAGEYTDADSKARRVAVSIGPEHGTVGPQQVKEAAKEAVQAVGFDVLIVCGFAFDPHVSEETQRYGTLTVLAARMNPDLSMGDEPLKKTGAGNLFMVFGELDITISASDENGEPRLTVEVKGVDVYDPTTGQIRSSSTDDIACWFIDTDYNGESFFVRHAYFTVGDEPYEKLKRALTRGNRRRRLVHALQHSEQALRATGDRTDCRQGPQSLRRRSPERVHTGRSAVSVILRS